MAGVIAAGGPATAAAGAAMLQMGGNAVDAAVAAAFVSFIAEIGVVHWGGSGIAHLYDPRAQRSLVYDFFSNTPGLGATPPAHLDFAKVVVDFGATTQDFYLGRAAVAVPGNIFGLCQLAADYGRFPLPTLLEPARQLAHDGVLIEPFQANTCDLLSPLYTHTADIRAIFAPNGRVIQPGERLFIPHLADTLAALAAEGVGLLRHGRLAQTLVADQQQNGGLLSATDLAHYEVQKADSIRIPYRDYEILLPPPSSTGGVLTAFSLKLLSHFDMAHFPHHSARHLQLLYEVMMATNRARPYWETWSESLPVETAIGQFLAEGFVRPYTRQIETALQIGQPSSPATEPDGPNHTSHLSVIDADGLAVSLTTTAGESAGYVVPGTGFIPNNMMGEEDLHPYGFHSRPPGVRLPTMMAPAIVLQDGMTRLVVGSGGSIRIRSAILQTLSNVLDYHLPLAEAVNRARVHLENGVLQCEAGYDETAVFILATALHYPVNRWPNRSIYFGGAHSVARTADGRLEAAGDNRRGGATARV
ncbi:MAG: gamma-glutamyltransferase [Anaerolineae bacterium]|nr:gamma-glutamyltransferase [Anaerolineae bacterium]